MATPALVEKTHTSAEVIHLGRKPIPFLKDALSLAMAREISIPPIDAPFLVQTHDATPNYLLAQTVRQSNFDTTGIILPLVGYAQDPSDTALMAGAAAQRGLDRIEVQFGPKAKTHMLGVLFGQEQPTLEALMHLDAAWGTTVDGLKVPNNPLGDALRERGTIALKTLAEQHAHGYAGLTNRQFEGNGGQILNVTEDLMLPVVAMPELDNITPSMLAHGYQKPIGQQTDIERYLRRGGVSGNDLLRAVLASIKGKEGANNLDIHERSLP